MATVAQILYPPPTKTGWDEFTRHHAEHHDAIEKAISEVLGIPSVGYNLYPFYKQDLDRWLREHTAAHQRFTQLLNIPGQDLSNLDFSNKKSVDAWIWQNQVEHLGASTRLGKTYV